MPCRAFCEMSINCSACVDIIENLLPEGTHCGQQFSGNVCDTSLGLQWGFGQTSGAHVTSPSQHKQRVQGSGFQSVLC